MSTPILLVRRESIAIEVHGRKVNTMFVSIKWCNTLSISCR
jgi:hypothetical protein